MAKLWRFDGDKPETTLGYYLSLEHGSETDKVPAAWRRHPLMQPMTLYGTSSFTYSVAGVYLLTLLYMRPERAVYKAEYAEALLLIWQGAISFKCDVLDIGVRSWSHPVDRISATLFTCQQALKYCFVRCTGSWGAVLYLLFGVLALGIRCFSASCVACREKDVLAFRFWHVTWHYLFPSAMIVFYSMQYLAPLNAMHCTLVEWSWW